MILSVEKQPDVDTITLTRQVEAALADLSTTLGRGITVDNILFRQANFIETSIKNVQTVLMEAIAVVAIVLFAFLLNVRTTAISLTAIPVSISRQRSFFWWMGLSINTMTLGGLAIAIGELVDDAVVDVENIFRRLRENREQGNPRSVFDVVVGASQEVRSGIVYATMIIILVFVPLFALTGIEGRLFAARQGLHHLDPDELGRLDHADSCHGGIFMLPGLKRLDEHEGWSGPEAEGRQSRAARLELPSSQDAHGWSADRRGCWRRRNALPRSFLPPFNEGSFTINLLFNPGISLAESHRVGLIAERLMMQIPEVRQVGRRTGRAELDEHAEECTPPKWKWNLKPSTRLKEEIIQDIRTKLAVLPVAPTSASNLAPARSHALGRACQIALKIYGEDLDTLRRVAAEFATSLQLCPASSTSG